MTVYTYIPWDMSIDVIRKVYIEYKTSNTKIEEKLIANV